MLMLANFRPFEVAKKVLNDNRLDQRQLTLGHSFNLAKTDAAVKVLRIKPSEPRSKPSSTPPDPEADPTTPDHNLVRLVALLYNLFDRHPAFFR